MYVTLFFFLYKLKNKDSLAEKKTLIWRYFLKWTEKYDFQAKKTFILKKLSKNGTVTCFLPNNFHRGKFNFDP